MSTASPHISFIYDRYKKASSKRKASIELRISYNRKQKYLSTGLSVFPKQWREGGVVNTPDCQQQNQMLEKLLTDVRQILMDMQEEGFIDIFSVPQRLDEKRNGGISLYNFIRRQHGNCFEAHTGVVIRALTEAGAIVSEFGASFLIHATIPFAVVGKKVVFYVLPAAACLLQCIRVMEMAIEVDMSHHKFTLHPPLLLGIGMAIIGPPFVNHAAV